MTKLRRIIVFCSDPDDWGDGRVLSILLEGLLARGFEVHYICCGHLSILPNTQLIAHVPYKKRWRANSLGFSLYALVKFLQLVCTQRFTAIISFRKRGVCLAKLSSLISWVPIYLFVDHVPWKRAEIQQRKRWFRYLWCLGSVFCISSAHRVLSSSSVIAAQIKSKLPGFLHSRVIVVPFLFSSDVQNLFDDSDRDARTTIIEHSGFSDRGFILASIGDFDALEPTQYLLRTLAAVEDRSVFLLVLGDGQLRSSILSIAVSLGLLDHVYFAGRSEMSLELLSGSDLIIVPSLNHGVSYLLTRSLGLGVPMLVGDNEEMAEVFPNDLLRYKPLHVEKLVQTLIAHKKSRELREQNVELLKECAEKFEGDWVETVADLLP